MGRAGICFFLLTMATGCGMMQPAQLRPEAPEAPEASDVPGAYGDEIVVENLPLEPRQALEPAPNEPAPVDAELVPPAMPPVPDAMAAVERSPEPVPSADEVLTDSPLDVLAQIDPDAVPERATTEPVAPVEPTFDIPIEVNDHVLTWIDRYSINMKQSFEAGLTRSGRYLGMFRDIFAEAGLPQDLVYMAHVESGYKTSAYSRAHARGVFQFIAATGRRYGLRVDYWVDERADPEKSARAAAQYMTDLYEEFGDWYLALAAYNAGEGKVRRGLARSGHRDFWSLARTRHLRRETKNHVPAILAATLLSKSPERYGLEYAPDDPIEYETIEVEGAVDLRVLARCAATDVDRIRTLNPALRRGQTPPDGSFDVRVPVGSGASTLAALGDIPKSQRVLYARHRVQRGDTLSQIASRYGVSVRAIQESNGMGRGTMIRSGQMLQVPTAGPTRIAASSSSVPVGEPLTYRVRRGDTLYGIGRRFSTTPGAIAAANGTSVHSILRVGQELTVVPGARSASGAVKVAQRTAAAPRAVTSLGSGVTHTVRRGDTLWRIAMLYGTTVNAICTLNRISPRTVIHPGRKLLVTN